MEPKQSEQKGKKKQANAQVNNAVFKERMELVKNKLELLDEKERLLSEQLNLVRDKKRKSKNNLEPNHSQNKISRLSLPYDNDFDFELNEKRTFFATAVVHVGIGNGEFIKVRAFMDTGAQPNIVSYTLFSKLEERVTPVQMARKLIGINGQAFPMRQKVNLKFNAWFDSEQCERAVFWVMPKEANWNPYMPDQKMNPFKNKNPSELPFADPNYWLPEQVNMLFGVGIFAKIIVSVIDRGVDGTAMMETKLGVIIFGTDTENLEDCEYLGESQVVSAIGIKEDMKLDKLLERLWQQDQIATVSKLSKEQREVEKHYVQNFKRDKSGRFIVKIPLKQNIVCFGSSKNIALKRFMYLERRFAREPETKAVYVEKMRESIRMGHIVLASERPKSDELVYYIPHHCIEKDKRIVYDASCKTDTGISLNDIQMLGAKLQNDLFETIMRFRRHRVAIYADIKKMFNQIKLSRDQWNLQRIFWRENSTEPLREYWLTVVTFGMTSSPFLAVRSVIQAAREAKERYPKAAEAIEKDFYMDDCVTGESSEERAIKLAMEIKQILGNAKFDLRKWRSNSKTVVNAMESEIEKSVIFAGEESSSILGLKWLMESDKFTFTVKSPKMQNKSTKRTIASQVAQLYDPNGYISPVVITGKIIIQDLWKARIGWDDKIPTEIEEKWIEFWRNIIQLEQFKIDRWIGILPKAVVQLHGFSDSSERALGACIYVRVQKVSGEILCNLLTSKSKVAPVKTVSIPRLELSATELLSRLVNEVKTSMEWPTMEYYLWTDSSISYYWIQKEPSLLKTYAANRVAAIQENTDIDRWRHIDGKDNPADLLTRGVTPSELIDNQFWLHGPSWLSLPQSEWPISRIMREPSEEAIIEMKINSVMMFKDPLRIRLEGQATSLPLIEYVDHLEQVVNILSFIYRFIELKLNKSKVRTKNKRKKRGEKKPTINPPTNGEKTKAMIYLIRKTQQEYFKGELSALKENRNVPDRSLIQSLRPILDEDGLIRLGGRLDRSEIDYEMKHPYIIPHESKLARLIMDYAHKETDHGGIQVMMQFIRQKYWIPRLRNGLRRTVHNCVVCVRMNARTETQLMAELPKERTCIGKPFLYTGVDYAGPFEIKINDGRSNRPTRKCWIAIFVCFITRAMHIEIVTDLSTAAFIASFERFIARRGRCLKMFSDNGKCFLGADKELQKAMEYWTDQEALDHIHSRGTEWRFMSPAAPHQGGIYEAAVKSMKHHLKRVIGQKILYFEQLGTLLTQIEAILNSRPLQPLSDDPKDMQALTPGHFLVGEPLVTPLPFNIDPKPDTSGVKLWRERQKMVQHFWDRWTNEYLVTLQERKKWRKEKENVRLGQLVVLKSENFPPSSWALGRICELLPSKDGLVRTVIVETATTRLKRPVQKICILPVEVEQHSD